MPKPPRRHAQLLRQGCVMTRAFQSLGTTPPSTMAVFRAATSCESKPELASRTSGDAEIAEVLVNRPQKDVQISRVKSRTCVATSPVSAGLLYFAIQELLRPPFLLRTRAR